MDPKLWQKAKPILDDALDQPRDRLESWLSERCGGDQVLLAEIKSLLDAEQAEDFETPLSRANPNTSSVGNRIGPYVIEDRLAVDSRITTYRAHHEEDNRPVRLLVAEVSHTSDLLFQLETEANIRSQLNHELICELYGYDLLDQRLYYLAEELLESNPERLQVVDRQSLEYAYEVIVNICDAVGSAHELGIVHGNLGMDTLGFSTDGQLKVHGFGKPLPQIKVVLTSEGPRLIVPANFSPELGQGESATPQSDVYALGVLFYQMLTGKPPYQLNAHTSAHIRQVLFRQMPPEPRSFVPDASWPPELDQLMMQILGKESGERPENGYFLKEALVKII